MLKDGAMTRPNSVANLPLLTNGEAAVVVSGDAKSSVFWQIVSGIFHKIRYEAGILVSGVELTIGYRRAFLQPIYGLACLALVSVVAPLSAADADAPGDKKNGPDAEKLVFADHLRNAGEQHRQRLLLAMKLRSEEIDRAVQLDDGQRKKVEIAAKGAVNRVVDKWLEQMLKNEGFEKQFDQMKAEQAVASLFRMGASLQVEQVTQVEFWKNGANEQFSAEQRKMYEKMVADRGVFERKVSIEQLVLTLDQHLRLSDQQRVGMTSLFDDLLDKKFRFQNSRGSGRVFARGIVHLRGGPQNPAAGEKAKGPYAKVSDEKVSKILSETQFKKWQEMRDNPAALAGGGMWGGGMQLIQRGGNNIIFDGAGGMVEINVGGPIVE
jgi:hypothetical protein